MHVFALCWFHAGTLLFLTRKGGCLPCESCSAAGDSCSGSKIICPGGLIKCGTARTVNTTGPRTIHKFCFLPSDCIYKGPSTFNVGKSGIVSSRLFCCNEDECNHYFPDIPPISTTFNGIKCPACFGLKKYTCNEEVIVECTGDQDYCLDMSGTARTGPPVAIKGCVNKVVCDDFKKGMVFFAGVHVHGAGTCLPMKTISGKADYTPELFALSLPVLACLLHVKILP
ncbi:phospholipase A2 inhibitor and Ly6/PLAUR domain-containing protein-like isoform X1 [Podarcis raffonei]|uniref:phospholipase A2 inhibitor and Ly6/PLAUR domain-containing protein-like isoform X1 n=1 Tax=Podarcis raffonei TaxID=65483 RepID=UPI0023298BCA|nr:phospholipase A2 inhibitor and Ly6/PLAUR domain-containing protein-like isoform X1 [Podarcis raffonei]